jgi:hypothetical protein
MKKRASGSELHPELPLALPDLGDPGVQSETALRVDGARVVFADYALLRRDFPQLRGASPARIDRWILHNAAVISKSQAAQEEVNTPIPTLAPVLAYRPPLYGRALVTTVDDGPGLLDVKGAGIAPRRKPLSQAHSNGLLALGEALANVAFRELIELVFRSAGTKLETVPEYAVLDLGFDFRDLVGPRTPAGMQVRRAHRRPVGGVELPLSRSPEQQVKLEIELLLRSYGLTSTSPATSFEIDDSSGRVVIRYAGKPIPPHPDDQIERFLRLARYDGGKKILEGVNVQLTRESGIRPSRGTAVDFGHYSVRERFEHTLVSLVRDREMRWGGAIRPEEKQFIQPDPMLAVSVAKWGTPEKPDPRFAVPGHPELIWPTPFVIGFELAHGFRAGTISGATVRRRLDAMIRAVVRRWERKARAA